MADGFHGFGERALFFYEGLTADNSRTYWQRHKDVYERDVLGPLRALGDELADEFGEPKIFRPHRDVRFSADKRPYKENASMVVQDGAALYVGLSVEGLFVAAGYYQPSREQLERFRALQDDDSVTPELDALLTRLAARGYPLSEGDPVRTAPRGYRQDHPPDRPAPPTQPHRRRTARARAVAAHPGVPRPRPRRLAHVPRLERLARSARRRSDRVTGDVVLRARCFSLCGPCRRSDTARHRCRGRAHLSGADG